MTVRGTPSPESGQFEVTLDGASIQPGKLPVRDLERLGPLLQNGLERTARVLRDEPGAAPGPLPREIQDATNLLLVAIQPGSAELVLELPLPAGVEPEEERLLPLPPRDLGQRAMEAFVRGLRELEGGSGAVPADWDNSVMEVAEALATFAHERSYSIDLSSKAAMGQRHTARIDPGSEERFRVRHAPIRRSRSCRGTLFLLDLKSRRVDVEDERGQRIQGYFSEGLEAEVKRLIGEVVLASGEEEVDLASSKRGRFNVTFLQPASEEVPLHEMFWHNKSAAEQADEQRVGPVASIADLTAAGEFGEGELDQWIDSIMESRRDQ